MDEFAALQRINTGLAAQGERKLNEREFRVTGSDVGVYPPASTLLDSLGIRWNEGFREENLHPVPDLAVVGNIIGGLGGKSSNLGSVSLSN